MKEVGEEGECCGGREGAGGLGVACFQPLEALGGWEGEAAGIYNCN